MATYATVTDLRAYATTALPTDDAECELLLKGAERDIDQEIFPRRTTLANGRKWDLTLLTTAQVAAINAATCAQAEYRNVMGVDFFVSPRYDTVSGPDFNTTGKAPILGPATSREIWSSGLVPRTARLLP